MGVDYTANYGIGVKLESLDFEELNLEDIGCMDEYLDELPKPDGIETEYFEVGQGSYTGEDNDYYLCIKSPMSEGVKVLKTKVDLFKNYLRRNDIKYVGEVDCVGGLNIW
tara:strand:+ start:1898 stop:2227 length:330 start_codon:yes stop_codon:yes gene_type:complete